MLNTSTPFPHLFQPIKIGRLKLKNRIIMTPVGTRLAQDGMVTDALKEFYAARARGGVGLIILEPGFIEFEGEGMFLGLYEDRFIQGLADMVQMIHAEGAGIGIQLFHAGWRPGEKDARFLAPIPPAELSPNRMSELILKYTHAAQRAQKAGFDLIEIHAGHGYLLSQFLSPLGNRRTDEYGGSVENRTRFLREIIQSVRDRVGADFPLSCRINGAENIPGGSTVEDARQTAPLLEKEGLHLLSVSAGALGSYPLTIPPSDTPPGCYTGFADAIRQTVTIPILTAGRINTPHLAEEILSSGKADLIAVARGLVADPDFPGKSYRGETDRIRLCIGCNACLDTDYQGHITCTVNPVAGRETELDVVPSKQSMKIIVAGAGLAGLEAARVAALRGHKVTVYEEADEIGGQWRLAAIPDSKREFGALLKWLSGELNALDVKIRLGYRITTEELENLKPDAVIVATGASPRIPPVPGFDREDVITAWEALQNVPAGENILVIGGGATGLETAEYLAEQGKQVSVVEMLKTFGSDMGGTVYFHLRTRLKQLGIKLCRNTEVRTITSSSITVLENGVEREWGAFDCYVLALGVDSRNELAEAIMGKVSNLSVIGDAAAPGNAAGAMRQGFEVGRQI